MSDVKRVLAIDPGEKVGWAHATVYLDTEDVAYEQPLQVTGHGITPLKDFAIKMHEVLVVDPQYDVLIYETWRLRAAKARQFVGNDFQPVQLIGMARLCGWLTPGLQLVSRPPGSKDMGAKSVASHPQGAQVREILENLPKTHDDAHDGDALLHLWHWYWEKFL